jgi:hypothetical protein
LKVRCDEEFDYTFHNCFLSLEILFLGVWHKFFFCE